MTAGTYTARYLVFFIKNFLIKIINNKKNNWANIKEQGGKNFKIIFKNND
jgi:hypothetical protein